MGPYQLAFGLWATFFYNLETRMLFFLSQWQMQSNITKAATSEMGSRKIPSESAPH